MRGSYAQMESRVGARIVPLGTTGNGVRDTCLENEATAQRLRPQANHDNPSWTWEVDNHRLALVLSLWIGQNMQMRLESEDKRGAYRCICISERLSRTSHARKPRVVRAELGVAIAIGMGLSVLNP